MEEGAVLHFFGPDLFLFRNCAAGAGKINPAAVSVSLSCLFGSCRQMSSISWGLLRSLPGRRNRI